MDADGTAQIKLHIHPGAKRTAVTGLFGDALKIDLQTPPVDGKANAALLRFLAEKLGLPRAAIRIRSGECSRDKVIVADGVSPDKLSALLD